MSAIREWGIQRTTGVVIVLSLLLAILVGVLVAFGTSTELPFLGAKTQTFILLLLSALVLLLVLLARGELGFGAILAVATVLISLTGFQLDLGPVRTSALEALLAVAVVLFLLRQRIIAAPPRWTPLVLDRPLLILAAATIPALLSAGARSIALPSIIMELKGYFLYPLLAYLIAAWATTRMRWNLLAWLGLGAAAVVGLSAILEAFHASGGMQSVFGTSNFTRASGLFGLINQYGFYVGSMAMVALGYAAGKRRPVQVAAGILAALLVVGVAVSGSRGAWLGVGAGLGAFFLIRRPPWYVFVGGVVGLAFLFQAQQNYFEFRAAEAAYGDLSRVQFLETGWRAFQRFPIFGAGWGANFYLNGSELVEAPGVPQLHNDYVNLLVQVGFVGLAAYLWTWIMIFYYSVLKVSRDRDHPLASPVAGALAGLVTLLVCALTDHVFWKTELAGQVWWLVGLGLAGARLLESDRREAPGSD